ncbi:MAG: sensory histidine kinase AtoS [Methanoregula sp. PtaU1.Bin051]|nr:MAG: sensory histidine kinase AtoS [Methanoregula sp. PtaU1.Bin051]
MLSVLYVDDEPALLEVGKMFLESSGMLRVETVPSAEKAIDILRTKPVDGIVADYQMPGMDGIAFLKYVRTNYGSLPYILFTGRGREEVVIEALNNGADFYLQKGGDPIPQFVELEHKIRLAIERRRTADELRQSRQRMNDIINHLPDATLAIDMNGTVIAWNRAMEEMTGVKKEEIVGTGNYSYAIPFYGERRPILLDLVLRDDPATEKKYPWINRIGKTLVSEIYIPILFKGRGAHLWFTASPLYDIEGNITGAIESVRDITDRKRAEDELRAAYGQIAASEEELREQYDELKRREDSLRESEEKYRTLFNEAADIIVILDTQGSFLNANRRFEEESGHRIDEMLGKNVLTAGIVTMPSAAKVSLAMGQLLLGKKPPLFEIDGITKDGTIIPYEIRASPIMKNGSVVRLQAILRNLTDRKKAEDAVRENQRRLEEIVHGSPIPQFVIDKDHRVISWNRALEEYSGIKAEEVVGTADAWKAFYEQKRPVLADLLVDQAIEKIPEWYAGKYDRSKYVDGAYEATDFFPRMGKSGVWLYFTASAIRDSKGTITGAVETLEDITERIRKEEALRQSEEKYRSLVDNLNVGVYRITAELPGRLLWANPAFVRMFGYKTLKELEAQPVTDMYVEPEKRNALLNSIRTQGFVRDYVVQLKGSDGKPFWASITAQTKKDAKGAIKWIDGICEDITDKKRSEEALLASEEKYRLLTEKTNDIIYSLDANGRVTHISPQISRYGYLPDEIIGKDLCSFVVEEDLKTVLTDFEKTVSTGEPTTTVFRARDKSGRIRWLEDNGAALFDRNGSVIGISGILRDITDKKIAEEHLSMQLYFLQQLIETIPSPVFFRDMEGVYTGCNRAFEEYVGLPRDEIIGKTVYQTAPKELADIYSEMDRELLARPGTQTYEAQVQYADGSNHEVIFNKATFSDPQGNVQGLVGIFIDVTELKQAERALKSSKVSYRTIFENTGTATVLIEEDTVISLANAEFVRLSGYSREEIEGKKSWTEFVVKEDLDRMLAQHRIRRERHEAAERQYEFRFVTRAGEIRNIFLTIDVIPGTKRSVASLMDITDRISAQEALKKINARLTLLNSITRHDIRNQLSALCGFLELAKMDAGNPVAIQHIERGERAAGIIEEQVEFTANYETIGINKPEWQDLDGVLPRSFVPGWITFSGDVSGVMVFADPMLEKVFYNLIDNSVRHGRKVTAINVSCSETPTGLIIVYTDDGIGIPGPVKEKIFDPIRGKNTSHGMFLSREILAITGITIAETGVSGKGARFEILVPKGAYRFKR